MSEPARAAHETVATEYSRTLWNHAVDARVIVDAQGAIRDVNRRAECKLRLAGWTWSYHSRHSRIWAANRSSGDAQFSIAVPLNAQGST
jgi:hypothetical protein